jgi:hypothetical protein
MIFTAVIPRIKKHFANFYHRPLLLRFPKATNYNVILKNSYKFDIQSASRSVELVDVKGVEAGNCRAN